VDDFKYLPRSFVAGYAQQTIARADPVPFTRLRVPLNASRIALLTTAGIWNTETDPPFDYAREQREPLWGDPSYRVLNSTLRQEQVGAGHLHLNNDDLLLDFNIALPIDRLRELVAAREVGALAYQHYSFMGFQGRGADGGGNTAAWEQQYAPEVATRMQAEGVDAVVLTPT
jgi:D-proline reductase (dithiol) PrdB